MKTAFRSTAFALLTSALLGTFAYAQDRGVPDRVGSDYPGVVADDLVTRINGGGTDTWRGPARKIKDRNNRPDSFEVWAFPAPPAAANPPAAESNNNNTNSNSNNSPQNQSSSNYQASPQTGVETRINGSDPASQASGSDYTPSDMVRSIIDPAITNAYLDASQENTRRGVTWTAETQLGNQFNSPANPAYQPVYAANNGVYPIRPAATNPTRQQAPGTANRQPGVNTVARQTGTDVHNAITGKTVPQQLAHPPIHSTPKQPAVTHNPARPTQGGAVLSRSSSSGGRPQASGRPAARTHATSGHRR